MAGESAFWAKLLCVGAKEPNPYRVIELSTSEFAVGRKEGCAERISDNTISSVHFRIRLVRPTCDDEADEETAMPEVWLEDGSANGTYVGAQKVGKGNRGGADGAGCRSSKNPPSLLCGVLRSGPLTAP